MFLSCFRGYKVEIKIIHMNGNLHAKIDIDFDSLKMRIMNRNESVKEIHFHTLGGLENAVKVLRIYKSLFHFNYHKHEICAMFGIGNYHLGKIVSVIKPNQAHRLIRKYLGEESKRVLNRI